MEIEKKFLVNTMPEDLESYPCHRIEQGYLCVDPVVRIRQSDDRYILTYKSRMGAGEESGGDVRVNQEIEAALSRSGYLHLRQKVDGHLITKSRYLISLEDGHMAELDVFHGHLEGLVFVEVEFCDEQDAARFVPPAWFGDNVSADHRYSNSFLSTCNGLEAFE